MSESSVEVSIDDLSPGDVILISAGEQIPVDGRVFKGHGLVDEQVIRGVHGLSRKGPEDAVLGGSTVRFGELQVEMVQQGYQTQAAGLARAILAVTKPAPGLRAMSLRGEELAERTIMPTMAAARPWDFWLVVSPRRALFCDLTMRLVQGWHFHSRLFKQ